MIEIPVSNGNLMEFSISYYTVYIGRYTSSSGTMHYDALLYDSNNLVHTIKGFDLSDIILKIIDYVRTVYGISSSIVVRSYDID